MAAAGKRSKVTVDSKNNRLLIVLEGTIRKADLDGIYTDVRFGVQDLRAPFDVITDLRHSQIGYLTGITTYLKIHRFLKENGVGRVVRITGHSKTFMHQIRKVTRVGGEYAAVYVRDMEEAEEYLAGEEGGGGQ